MNALIFSLLAVSLQILTLESISDDPFPGDVLTPYKDHYRTRRNHRFVRDCQHIKFGNTTHETFHVSTPLVPDESVAYVHNFFHEFSKGGESRNVVGHLAVVPDPLRTFSVLEPKEIGGCSRFMRATVAESSKQRRCYMAANGGMFRTRDGKCYGNIFSDGRKVQDSEGVQNANFGIREDGTIVVGYLTEEDVLRKENPFLQLISGVVWLLRNGASYVNESKKAECRDTEETGTMDVFAGVLSARTALGHDNEGRVMIAQVDGKTHKRGIDLYNFADLLLKLGFVNAINLDGGGSATMVLNGTVINYPSDRCGAFSCPRPVSTIVCVHEPYSVSRNCSGHGQRVMDQCVCDSGWTGEACDVLECKQNDYCSPNGICSDQGGCICHPGWEGENCGRACSSGWFGANCSQKCLCLEGGICNPISGHCNCTPGWTGPYCGQRCFHGSYGQNCLSSCDCPGSCDCDPETGKCLLVNNNTVLNSTKKWLQCVSDLGKEKSIPTASLEQTNTEKVLSLEREFSKLFVWFVAVISLCGISFLANLFLIYLACNRASTGGLWKRRYEDERQLLFHTDDDEENAL
ncbi:N-acetylglucosamine-1-phosphodiester alpha-N-acetylglucosaminidase-like [Montipora capricornis]|uniref:N-acetylglucosamine-1-phosphodiester alpha-N-acetylglucosaminidase-like n=1 Tax=Montipora capricornis TaxID=246305 RepID=UPI0035F1352B